MVIIVLLVLISIVLFFVYQASKPAPVEEDTNSDSNTVELHMFSYTERGYYFNVWPKVDGVHSYVEFYIAGVGYRSGIDNHLGEFVGRLVPEPNNPYDPNAIRIQAPDGTHLGYVPKDRTNEVRAYTSLPCTCCCFIARRGDKYITCCYIKR